MDRARPEQSKRKRQERPSIRRDIVIWAVIVIILLMLSFYAGAKFAFNQGIKIVERFLNISLTDDGRYYLNLYLSKNGYFGGVNEYNLNRYRSNDRPQTQNLTA